MTANDARALSSQAAEQDATQVRLVVSLWQRAIEAAARDGRLFVRRASSPGCGRPSPRPPAGPP